MEAILVAETTSETLIPRATATRGEASRSRQNRVEKPCRKGQESSAQYLNGISRSLTGLDRSLKRISQSLDTNRQVSETTNNLLLELIKLQRQAKPATANNDANNDE